MMSQPGMRYRFQTRGVGMGSAPASSHGSHGRAGVAWPRAGCGGGAGDLGLCGGHGIRRSRALYSSIPHHQTHTRCGRLLHLCLSCVAGGQHPPHTLLVGAEKGGRMEGSHSIFNCCRFGKQYELPLLVQSIVMTATMLAMMQLCVEVNSEKGTLVQRRLLGGSVGRVWDMPHG